MPDTNVFGDIVEGKIDLDLMRTSDAEFCVTHIQRDELEDISDEDLKDEILGIFDILVDDRKSTHSMVWGISKWGEAKWSAGEIYNDILGELNEDDGNEIKDALIAEAAIENGIDFITADRELQNALEKLYPQQYISERNFINWLQDS